MGSSFDTYEAELFGRWFCVNWYKEGNFWLAKFFTPPDLSAKVVDGGNVAPTAIWRREAQKLESVLSRRPGWIYLMTGCYTWSVAERVAWGCTRAARYKAGGLGKELTEGWFAGDVISVDGVGRVREGEVELYRCVYDIIFLRQKCKTK